MKARGLVLAAAIYAAQTLAACGATRTDESNRCTTSLDETEQQGDVHASSSDFVPIGDCSYLPGAFYDPSAFF
jgi:hypothetical protein